MTTYRDLVVDGMVRTHIHVSAPADYVLGDPLEGWEGWTPVAIVGRSEVMPEQGLPARTVVLLSRLQPATPRHLELVSIWNRLDGIAEVCGIPQTGPAWDLIFRIQRWQLGVEPLTWHDVMGLNRLLRDAGEHLMDPERRLWEAYLVSLEDPNAALRLVTSDGEHDGFGGCELLKES